MRGTEKKSILMRVSTVWKDENCLHLSAFVYSSTVVVDDVVPAVVRHQAIDRSEIDARLPLRGRDCGGRAGRGRGMDVHGRSLPRRRPKRGANSFAAHGSEIAPPVLAGRLAP